VLSVQIFRKIKRPKKSELCLIRGANEYSFVSLDFITFQTLYQYANGVFVVGSSLPSLCNLPTCWYISLLTQRMCTRLREIAGT